ncbi:MAG: radical SAM protein [Candidatus Omnitrophica bacterium]|nr:radical SAM protein [Candidatus Omnitrophota bacterium]
MGVSGSSAGKKARIINYLFKTKLLGKPIPLCVILAVTQRCQCDCRFCSVSGRPGLGPEGELSTEEIKGLVDQIAALGAVKINFFGGEPLLRGDILDLVNYASRKGLFVFIDTNGLLLDGEMVSGLKKAGASCLLLSLSSIDEQRHDAVCGREGVFRKARQGIEHCIRQRLPYAISTVATHESLSGAEIGKIIDFARYFKASGVRILLPMLSGKWQARKEELLDNDELRQVEDYLEPGFVYLESGFSRARRALPHRKCCASRKEIIYISSQGEVRPCYTVPLSFGNVRKAPLKKILGLMWKEGALRSMPRDICPMSDPHYRESVLNGARDIRDYA